jgi:hypothetical protein
MSTQKVESFNKVNSIIEATRNEEQLEYTLKTIELFNSRWQDDSLLEILKENFKYKRQQYNLQ